MRTRKYCNRCGCEVKRETHKGLRNEYPFFCPVCDENMYRFETHRIKEDLWCVRITYYDSPREDCNGYYFRDEKIWGKEKALARVSEINNLDEPVEAVLYGKSYINSKVVF